MWADDLPIIRSRYDYGCGVGCVATALVWHSLPADIDALDRECGAGSGPITLRTLRSAARRAGLKADAYRMDADTLRDRMSAGDTLAMLWWHGNHFVLLYGFDGDDALIVNPVAGRVRMPGWKYEKFYTGYCMIMGARDGSAKEGENRERLASCMDHTGRNDAWVGTMRADDGRRGGGSENRKG